jgi:Cof subfamily protein (haloacid dehalogenase superfamily)
MDFSQIKLVVTDMDGTLLNDEHEVSQRFLEQFKALKKRNIHFVAASGRQFQSIQQKLHTIKDEISIIGENGGIMQHAHKVQVLLKLNANDVQKCIKTLRKVGGAYIVLCGRKTAYIESDDDKFYTTLKNYYAEVKQVEDLSNVTDDDFLKIAVFHFDSSETHIYPHVKNFEDNYQVIVSGQNWLDISHIKANKSYALKMIQDEMGLTSKETLAFGDFNNDIGMLKLAEMSFAMKNAHPNVIRVAKFRTKSNNKFGVEVVLDELIKAR